MTPIIAVALLLVPDPPMIITSGPISPSVPSDKIPTKAFLARPYSSFRASGASVTVLNGHYFTFSNGSNFIFDEKEDGEDADWIAKLVTGSVIVSDEREAGRALKRRMRARSRSLGSSGTRYEVRLLSNNRAKIYVTSGTVSIKGMGKYGDPLMSDKWHCFNTGDDSTTSDVVVCTEEGHPHHW